MVYRGKPSAACGECRKRRSRCDQALPACGQCIKAKRICPGYRNTADLLFFDESSQVVKKNRTRAAAPSISVRVRPPIRLTGVVLYQPLNDLAVNFFMSNYTGHDSATSQFDYLPGFYLRDIVPKPELRQSIEAVGLASYAKASRRSDLVLPATRSYVSAIREINDALSNDLSVQQDSTLLSVILLAMFEVMILPRASGLQNVTKHLNGATSIATLRLQHGITTEYGNKLIGTLVQAVVLNCWMQNIALPPEFIVLRDHLDDRLTTASMHTGFLGLVMDLIQFRSALNDGLYESDMIKLEAYALDARFKAFGDDLLPENSFKGYWSAAEIDQLVYKGCYHVYSRHFTAHLWNNIRLCRIRLHRVILSQYITPNSSPMENTSVYPQIARSEGVIQELARDICASVPQLSGYLECLESYSKKENASSMPHESVSKTSTSIPLTTHFLYNPDPFKQQHSPASSNTDINFDSHFPAPRSESLYHVLYHLHIISNIEFLPASMRNWAHGRIAWMEASADPEELSQLRALLNSRTEAGFPVLVDAMFPGRTGGGNAGNMGRFILKRPISFHHFY